MRVFFWCKLVSTSESLCTKSYPERRPLEPLEFLPNPPRDVDVSLFAHSAVVTRVLLGVRSDTGCCHKKSGARKVGTDQGMAEGEGQSLLLLEGQAGPGPSQLTKRYVECGPRYKKSGRNISL